MLTYLRYGLATLCFAASVACVPLWWRSMTHGLIGQMPIAGSSHVLHIQLWLGLAEVEFPESENPFYSSPEGSAWYFTSLTRTAPREGPKRLFPLSFGQTDELGVYFPIWYAALIFALAGVAALRLGRRFTLRSAIIATAVVAGLLGMAVAL